MRFYNAATILALLFCMLYGCTSKAPEIIAPLPEDEVLTVDEKPYTAANLLTALQKEMSFEEMIATWAQEKSTAPNVGTTTEKASLMKLLQQAGRTFAFEEAIAQKARKAGLDQLPDFQTYTDDTVKSELFEKMVFEDVLQNIQFTDEQLLRSYELNKNNYKNSKSDRFSFSGFYIRTNDKPADEAWQKMQEALGKLKAGEDFYEVARQYSEAPEAGRGLEQEANVSDFNNPEIPRALMKLKDGEFSQIIPSNDKLLIYKRYKYTPPEYVPFENVKTQISEMAMADKRDQELALLYQQLSEKHKPSLFPEMLINPTNEQMDLNIISLPGIYEMTLREFLQSAETLRKFSYKDKFEYLHLLSQKSVMAKEAQERGWSQESVSSIVTYYQNKWLTGEYIKQLSHDRLPTEHQMKDFYAKNLKHEQFQVPKKHEIYYLFFPANYSPNQTFLEQEKQLLSAKQRAMQAHQDLIDGASFETIVPRYSHDDYHKQSNGFLGLVDINQLGAQRSNALLLDDLQPGEFSEPHEIYQTSKNYIGYEIYYVKDIEPARIMTYPEAKELMLNAAKANLFQEEHKRLLDEWESEHTIQFHSLAMEHIKEYLIQLIDQPDRRQFELYRYAVPEQKSQP